MPPTFFRNPGPVAQPPSAVGDDEHGSPTVRIRLCWGRTSIAVLRHTHIGGEHRVVACQQGVGPPLRGEFVERAGICLKPINMSVNTHLIVEDDAWLPSWTASLRWLTAVRCGRSPADASPTPVCTAAWWSPPLHTVPVYQLFTSHFGMNPGR